VDLAALFRLESGRATAGLARRLGDLDQAEDAVGDAFVLALERWPRDGVPSNPAPWIAVTALNRAIDRIRRERNAATKHERLARLDAVDLHHSDAEPDALGDDRLELLFACIHPALGRDVQVALTLRALGGLTTDEIADAFFTSRTAMQQRLVRAKNKIRTAGIPFSVPAPGALRERLDAVTAVVYLIFNTGYAPAGGEFVTRPDLCESAIGICDLIRRMLPEHPEAHALDALMRFHYARRSSRVDANGAVVLLERQDRTLWDAREIARASASLKLALALPRCSLTYEAYIAAAHAHAPTFEETDWDAIVVAYDALIALHDTPVARCNRAVALAMRGDVARASAEVAALATDPAMIENRYYHVACAQVAELAGERNVALHAYRSAMAFAGERDRQTILVRLRNLEERAAHEPDVRTLGR
jgi:RNA polymerase sigma-70 factor (ECF subfamily)